MITPQDRERHFLQTLWQNRLFECEDLTLTDGTPFEIVSTGVRSDQRGRLPDFSFAAIRFLDNGVTLHGSIKIDTHSSHWREQGTVNAPEFSSVVLHIVANQDMILTQGNREIPTLVLRPTDGVTCCHDRLRKGGSCQSYITAIDPVMSHHLLTRVMSDRLSRKKDEVLSIFRSVGEDWHETTYICFVRAFGYGSKKQSFETLARTLPLRYLRLHSDSLSKMEAMLLGQSGYLEVTNPDKYTRILQDEYTELRHRHGLNPRHISWGGTTLRPGSLPVQSLVRIAAILKEEDTFLDRILDARNVDELTSIFDVLLSEYWQTHYAPSHPAAMNAYGMTRQKSELMVINFVIPLLIAYGEYSSNDDLRDRAFDLYEKLPPEDNRYIRQWAGGGFEVPNAFFSQALIQLSSEYCDKGLCASCPLGIEQLSEVFKNSKQ